MLTNQSLIQGDQIGTFGAKFEKFGTLSKELATKSPKLKCQLFWHPFGTFLKFVKKFPKCSVFALILKKNCQLFLLCFGLFYTFDTGNFVQLKISVARLLF